MSYVQQFLEIQSGFAALNGAMDSVSTVVRRFGEQMEAMNRRTDWSLKILFADTEKDRRRIRRDMARTYRRPAVIHNGKKPR